MFENSGAKLLVYASSFTSRGKRLKPISGAAEKMGRQLNVNVEIKTFRRKFTHIYVYYKSGDEEPIPIYCNHGEESKTEDIYATLRNMMFVLSFHPRHSALRQLRNEIIRFS